MFSFFQSKASNSAVYSPLYSEGQDEKATNRPPNRRWTYVSILMGAFNVVMLVFITIFSVTYDQNATFIPRKLECDCGDTVVEAKVRDCQFDVLSLSWLPPHCIDAELTAEFNSIGDRSDKQWLFWLDQDWREVLTTEEVGMRAIKSTQDPIQMEAKAFYTTWRFHVAHCSYYWRKDFRMRARGWTSEDRYNRESHIQHCHDVFMDDKTNINITITKANAWIGGDRSELGNGHDHHHHHPQ